MPMKTTQCGPIPSIIACAHVISRVSDSQALCSGGRESSGGDLNL